jgi:hypothetical protein
VTVGGIVGQGTQENSVECSGKFGIELAGWYWVWQGQMHGGQIACEGEVACAELVEEHAECVDIASFFGMAVNLFRWHVGQSPGTSESEVGRVGLDGEPEVAQDSYLCPVRQDAEEDIKGLDITVDEVMFAMGVVDGPTDLGKDG